MAAKKTTPAPNPTMKPGPAYILPYRKEIKSTPTAKPTAKPTPAPTTWQQKVGKFIDDVGNKLDTMGREKPPENPYLKPNSLYKPQDKPQDKPQTKTQGKATGKKK